MARGPVFAILFAGAQGNLHRNDWGVIFQMPFQHPGRLAHIDAIRAVAAILVLLMHAASARDVSTYSKTHGAWFYDFAFGWDLGRIGVVIFFLVSGFLIPTSLCKGNSLPVFALRRFFRLYPAFWLSVGLAAIIEFWLYDRGLTVSMVLANLTMAAKLFSQPYMQGLYWTLLVELLFYVLCAIAFATGVLHRSLFLASATAAFTLLYGYQIFVAFDVRAGFGRYGTLPLEGEGNLYLCALSMMFFGACLRKLADGEKSFALWCAVASVVAIYGIVYPLSLRSLWIAGRMTNDSVSHFGATGIGLLTFSILAFVAKITWRPIVKIGEASYSLYLFHPVVLWGLIWIFVYPLPESPLGTVELVAIISVASLLASLVLYRFVERPAIDLGRSLERRLGWSRSGVQG